MSERATRTARVVLVGSGEPALPIAARPPLARHPDGGRTCRRRGRVGILARMRRRSLLLLVVGLGAALPGGCQPAPVPPSPPVIDGAFGNEISAWPFWPRRMRIHPLTRLVSDENLGQLVIEARIEFRDDFNNTTKGVGQLRFDLHDVSGGRGDPPLTTWDHDHDDDKPLDLGDLTLNARYFDDVTRTYLFRLGIDPADLPAQPQLRAYFVSADGQKLTADYRLR